jgi:hypothetical protein
MRFFTLVYFIKQLLLVPLDMPRKDFKFFRIFEKLFVFLINSPVYSIPGSRDSLVYSPLGSHDSPVYSSLGSKNSPVMNTWGSQPKFFKRNLLVQNTLGSQDSLRSLDFLVYLLP